MSLQQLTHGRNTRGLNGWRYLQLNNFVNRLPQPIRSGRQLTDFEKLCDKEAPRNTVSQIYKILLASEKLEMPPFIFKWERDLGTKKDIDTIKKIFKISANSKIDSRTAEMNYKCISRSYLTPEITSKYQKGPATCWRGCQEIGTMGHMWWSCLIIKNFWHKILVLIKEITGIEVADDPWEVLFLGGMGDLNNGKQTLVPQLLNAAKRTIPRNWQRRESPEIWEWFDAIEEICNLETLECRVEEIRSKNLGSWDQWKKFKKTWSYAKEINSVN